MTSTSTAATVYLGLGSNLGTDPEKLETLRRTVRELNATPGLRITGASSVYRTPPWGVTDQPDFFNAVLRGETTLAPGELLRSVKATEVRLGRVASYRWGPRLIDIDLLLYGGREVSEEGLKVPHPRLLDREFVLIPLVELEPEIRLPDGRRVSEASGLSGNPLERVGPL